MANQVEGLNGTRSTYEYENIEIVEIDGVRMVRRLKDKKIIGLNSPKKEPQEGYYQRQFNKSQPRYQDLALKEELIKHERISCKGSSTLHTPIHEIR